MSLRFYFPETRRCDFIRKTIIVRTAQRRELFTHTVFASGPNMVYIMLLETAD